MAIPKDTISQAIESLKAQRAELDEQIRLLTQALKPQLVGAPAARRKKPALDKPSNGAVPRKSGSAAPSGEEIASLLGFFPEHPVSLTEVFGFSDMPKKKTREALNALVDNGDVIQMGAKKTLRFRLRGTEVAEGVE